LKKVGVGIVVKALRAMIVDDNAIDRAYLRAMLHYLTEGKVEIDEADSGAVAAELFRPGRYDLVVSDYHLTGVETGFDVLSRVKRDDPTCRRILVTGDSRKALAKHVTQDSVAESVVLKSSGPAVLREALTPLLPN
jgi:CheY-like chemotaxis protein